MSDDSCAIIPLLLLEYQEAKIQMVSVFKIPQYVKIQISLFSKARSKKFLKSYSKCGEKSLEDIKLAYLCLIYFE